MEKNRDLNERLIEFASYCIDVAESLPNTYAGNYFSGQLIRSGSSPALHYGEAKSAESASDFVHKMKVCLKELRETYNCLKLIKKKNWSNLNVEELIVETDELIAIFCSSINTAQKSRKRKSV